MSRGAPCSTALNTLIQTSLLSSPNGTRETPSTACTLNPLTPKFLSTVVLIMDVLSPLAVSQRPRNQSSASYWLTFCRLLDDGSKLFAYLDDWYLWIKPQCLDDALVSTLSFSPSKSRCGELIARTLSPKLSSTRSDPHSVALEDGHLHIQGDTEPSSVVLGEQATTTETTKTTQRFRAIASTFAELNGEGSRMQTVNDFLTTYVGAASQHVLRMSFASEHEATTYDTEVAAFWSQLIKRDATSPLFHLPLKMDGLGVGSAAQGHAAAPWRAWQWVHSPR